MRPEDGHGNEWDGERWVRKPSKSFDFAFWVVIALMLTAIGYALVTLFMSTADAHDRMAMNDQKRGDWYNSLKSEAGGWCCDMTDAAHIDQKYVRQMVDQTWQVFLTDLEKWVSVPPDRVVHNKPSIDGEPYLFRYPVQLYDGSLIRCFVPPIPGY